MTAEVKNGNICNMNRSFIRKRQEIPQQAAEKINIGVIGMGQSVGTTFVSSTLAFYFAEMGKSVTFTQCADPGKQSSLLYDAAAMDRRFSSREFTDFYKLIYQEQRLKRRVNMEQGINWVLITPQNCKDRILLNGEQRARLIGCAGGEVCIFDIDQSKKWRKSLRDMNMILAVTDPLPSKMIRSAALFSEIKQLEIEGVNVIWVVNKVNGGVNRRQVTGYLKTREIMWIEHFDTAMMYADEYFCRFPWENSVIKRRMMDIFTKLSH